MKTIILAFVCLLLFVNCAFATDAYIPSSGCNFDGSREILRKVHIQTVCVNGYVFVLARSATFTGDSSQPITMNQVYTENEKGYPQPMKCK